ncbi:hypothetical protein AB1Y20_005604 [Prymnesium parvum]|uniref:Enhancer of rudimentary homolog n=1 Tax=Prymnesium parvum TaxID=97485 RepID=A0AB34J4S2_PRYPA
MPGHCYHLPGMVLVRSLSILAAAMVAGHAILLIQYGRDESSRTFLDFASVALAADGICAVYEKGLKALNPNVRHITYDIADIYHYVDQLADLACLVYDAARKAYVQRDKDWIKRRIYERLHEQAS